MYFHNFLPIILKICYILSLLLSSICMACHWERAQGSLFTSSKLQTVTVFVLGLTPASQLGKLIYAQRHVCKDIIYTMIFLCPAAFFYQLTTHRHNSTETLLFPNLFFTCGLLPVQSRFSETGGVLGRQHHEEGIGLPSCLKQKMHRSWFKQVAKSDPRKTG